MNNFTQVEKGECLLKFLPEGMATVETDAYFRAATMGEVRFAAGTLHFKADLLTWCADSFCIEAGGVIKCIPDLHVLNEIPGGMFGVTFGQSSGPRIKACADFAFAKPSASHNIGGMKIIKGSQSHDQ